MKSPAPLKKTEPEVRDIALRTASHPNAHKPRVGGPGSRRVFWVFAALAIVSGGLMWLLVFDLWLGQAERQYLWETARYELKQGPRVSLKGTMAQATRDAAWIASAWALLVVAAVVGAGVYGYREGRRTLRDSSASHASHSKGEP
jgi:hypothetical protein